MRYFLRYFTARALYAYLVNPLLRAVFGRPR